MSDDEPLPCEFCDGTGMSFEGDIHVGNCIHCGGSGYES